MSFLAKKLANLPRVSLRSNVDFAQPWPAPKTFPKTQSPRFHHRRLVFEILWSLHEGKALQNAEIMSIEPQTNTGNDPLQKTG